MSNPEAQLYKRDLETAKSHLEDMVEVRDPEYFNERSLYDIVSDLGKIKNALESLGTPEYSALKDRINTLEIFVKNLQDSVTRLRDFESRGLLENQPGIKASMLESEAIIAQFNQEIAELKKTYDMIQKGLSAHTSNKPN